MTMHAFLKLQSDARRVKPVLIAGVLILMSLHVHLDVCMCGVPWACLCSPVSNCRVLMLHSLAARYVTWLLIKLTPKCVVFAFLYFLYSNRVAVGYVPLLPCMCGQHCCMTAACSIDQSVPH